jgi:DNA-binding XRE family transcriptional regulator
MRRDYRNRHQLPHDLGGKLRVARSECGWTIHEAARRTGISRGMLSYLERGLRAPSTVVAERRMEVYGLCGRVAEAAGGGHPRPWQGMAPTPDLVPQMTN